MLHQRILETLKDLYGFTEPQYLDRSHGGFSGNSFLITDQDHNYFVKRYHFLLTTDEIQEIHAVKNLYKSHGLPTITPLHNIYKADFFIVGGSHYAVFPHVIGKNFDGPPTERAARSMGELLAQQHIIGEKHLTVLNKKKEFEGWDEEVFLSDTKGLLEHIDALQGHTEFDQTARAFIQEKLAASKAYPITYEELGLHNDHLIHGDFHHYNVFFSEDDTVSHVFDFDRAMRGPRAVDVVYSLFLTCFDFNYVDDPSLEKEYKLAEAFLAGYHRTYPLKREEFVGALTWYLLGELARTHWIEFEWYYRDNKRVHALLPERRARFTYMLQNLDYIKERLVGYVFPGEPADLH